MFRSHPLGDTYIKRRVGGFLSDGKEVYFVGILSTIKELRK